jgi:hypothetical protein
MLWTTFLHLLSLLNPLRLPGHLRHLSHRITRRGTITNPKAPSLAELKARELRARVGLGIAEVVGWLIVLISRQASAVERLKEALEGKEISVPQIVLQQPVDLASTLPRLGGATFGLKGNGPVGQTVYEEPEKLIDRTPTLDELERRRGGSPPLPPPDMRRRSTSTSATSSTPTSLPHPSPDRVARSVSHGPLRRASSGSRSFSVPREREGSLPSSLHGTLREEEGELRSRGISTYSHSASAHDGFVQGWVEGAEEELEDVEEDAKEVLDAVTRDVTKLLSEDKGGWWMYYTMVGMVVIAYVLGNIPL